MRIVAALGALDFLAKDAESALSFKSTVSLIASPPIMRMAISCSNNEPIE